MWAIWRPDAVAVLKDKGARRSLARYFDVMQNDKPAKFLIAKKLPANFRKEDSLEKLWKEHDRLIKEFHRLEKEIDSRQKSLDEMEEPKNSYLDLKIEIANRILESCHFCTRRCGFNRLAGELGYCRCGTQITVSTMFEHMGEEPELVPSGTIFTLGCSMRCLHCQNWSICLAGDTDILLADGSVVNISNLVENEMRKKNAEKIGDSFCVHSNLEVLTVDSQGKVVVDKCNGLSKRKASSLFEITTKAGRRISVTPNHQLYSCFNGLVLPVAAKDLKRGDFIAAIRCIPDTSDAPKIEVQLTRSRKDAHHITIPEKFSPELCRFIGYMLGNGHVYAKRERGIYTIAFTSTDETLINDFYNCCVKVFNVIPRIERHGRTLSRVLVHSIELFQVLSQIAPSLLERSRSRRVPKKIMQCNKELVASFLKAFFDCKAIVHPRNGEIDLHSSSQGLLQQIQLLLCKFGIISQLRFQVYNRGKRVKRIYRLLISGENIRHYSERIGFLSLKKRKKMKTLLAMNPNSWSRLDVIPNISQLLRDIRQKLRLSQRDIQYHVKNYGIFERGCINPHRVKAKQIASVFEARFEEIRSLCQRLQELTWSELKESLRRLRISQREIAELLGVSRSLIRYYESNQDRPASKKFLKKIIAAASNLCLQILGDDILNEHMLRLKMLVDSDIFWDEITEIRSVRRKNQWVYDVRLKNTHRFIANMFLVHNSQWYETGEVFSPKELAQAVERLRKRGCRNANLVGGEPTPWLEQWLETFKHVKVNVPVVWNSNAYYSEETAKLLVGFADVYLLDFKYGSNECAKRISDAPHYWEACTRNHLYAKQYGELIIRVLVLPGHLECCTKVILNWIAKNLGTWVRTNVMFQYRPEWRAHEVPELRRRLTRGERDRAIELAREAGLTNFIT